MNLITNLLNNNKRKLIFIVLILLIFSLLGYTNIVKEDSINNSVKSRGLIAFHISKEKIYISWRCKQEDFNNNCYFNIFRNNIKLNKLPVKNFNYFIDSTFDSESNDIEYVIKKFINGKEVESFNTKVIFENNIINISLLPRNNYFVHHIWPGDLNGDGEYDLVVSRLPLQNDSIFHPILEGYLLNGKYLWTIDMGPWSIKKLDGEGVNDAPPASISGYGNVAGYRDNDNVTVYDINGDGISEVFVRTSTGVVFADGKLLDGIIGDQFISVVNGGSGNEIFRISVPEDFKKDGPLGGNFGIAYLDGKTPSLITKFVNRRSDKKFNCIICAYDWVDNSLKLKWKWIRDENSKAEYFHQIRIIDVDRDGKDDICAGNFVINSYGNLLYIIDSTVHGDRFYITDINPDRRGLEGFAIQQTENGIYSNFSWYYYDASIGKILFKSNVKDDVGRGIVANVDPRYRGYEFWANEGIYNSKGEKISNNIPPVNLRIWWDGDVLDEILDKTSIYKWDYINNKSIEIYKFDDVISTLRNVPPFYGDIVGDWREEVIYETIDHKYLKIFISPIPSNIKIVNPIYNRAYRLCFTTHGYYQSNLLDIFAEN